MLTKTQFKNKIRLSLLENLEHAELYIIIDKLFFHRILKIDDASPLIDKINKFTKKYYEEYKKEWLEKNIHLI